MNAGPFAVVPNESSVYRAMAYENHVHKGRAHFRAFRLRAATEKYPEEDSLSVGRSVTGAKAGLTGNTYGVAELLVAGIHSLPYGLQVRETADDEKAAVFGLPRHSETQASPEAQDLALTIAKDLAALANERPLILE